MKLKGFTQKDRYGNSMSVEFFEDNSIPALSTPEYDHPGEPRGPDTVPAWLTPGEFVVNAEAVRMFEPEIEAMNEAGRAVQREQGGTIPEYKADGGSIIQDVTDFFTMPSAPPGITYKRMPGGYIGEWAGNKYLGRLEEKKPSTKRREDTWDFSSMFNSAGGPIYAEEGIKIPSWLTDDLLDNLKMVESGGDVNATSEAGALGPYQIMPSTAAKPGMGVAPLDIEDIRDPNKSRQFARDYLAAIARKNPDFTQEEVITAYHSGAGNVRKAKEGTEPLGKRGLEYAGKVLSYMNPISSAEASTSVPKMDEVPQYNKYDTNKDGVVDKEEALAARNQLINREVTSDGSTPFGIMPTGGQIPVYSPETLVQRQEQKLDDMIEAGADAETIKAQAEKLKIAEGIIPKQKAFSDRLTAEEALANVEENINKAIEKANVLEDAGLTERAEQERQKAATLKEEVPPLKETLNEAVASEDALYSVPKEASIPEYEIDSVSKPPETKPEEDAAQAAARKVNEHIQKNTVTKTGGPGDDQTGDVDKQGQDELDKNPDLAQKLGSYFKDAFKDLFSGPELARMIIMYAGSRAMGYDHGGSLQYAMNQYVTRVDAQQAAKQKEEALLEQRKFELAKSNLDDYTAESRKKFMETMDVNDLVPKGETATTIMSEEGFAYIRGYGEVPKVKLSDKSEAVLINGKPVRLNNPTIAGLVEPYNKEMQGKFVVADRFAKNVENAVGVVNQGVDEKQQIRLNASSIGTQAASLVDKVLIQNGVSIRDAYQTEMAMQKAIADFAQANADFKAGRTKVKPYSLEQYFNKQVITPLTGISQETIGKTTPQNLGKLDNIVRKGMDDKFRGRNGYRVPGYKEEYYNEWQAIYRAWSALGPDGRAAQSGKTPEGWSDFAYWASKTPASEIEKLIK